MELEVNKQKKPFVIQYQKQNFSVPFHQVIFDHSVSCVLLIDKPNESFKNSKHSEEIPYPPKKSFKKKIKHYTR